MATWDDVERIMSGLPSVQEGTTFGNRAWRIGSTGPAFAWDRPLSKKDRRDLGDAAPDGPILAVRLEDIDSREALLSGGPPACFTIPHFDGYPAVLVRLPEVEEDELVELLEDGWLAQAPAGLADDFLAHRQTGPHKRS
jgi:hypothetical protein